MEGNGADFLSQGISPGESDGGTSTALLERPGLTITELPQQENDPACEWHDMTAGKDDCDGSQEWLVRWQPCRHGTQGFRICTPHAEQTRRRYGSSLYHHIICDNCCAEIQDPSWVPFG